MRKCSITLVHITTSSGRTSVKDSVGTSAERGTPVRERFHSSLLGVRKSSPNIIHIPKLDFFCAWVAWFPVLLLQLGRGGQMFRAACNPFLVLGSGLTAFSAEGFQCSGGMDQVLDADSRLGRPHFHLALALNAKHMGLLLPRSCLLPLH